MSARRSRITRTGNHTVALMAAVILIVPGGAGCESTAGVDSTLDGFVSGSGSALLVDTGQQACYDNDSAIPHPEPGEPFYGQDAQFEGLEFSFVDNGDGTVTDLNTGLMWQQTPSSTSYGWQDAQDHCCELVLGGYDDWRAPSLKELFSISDFETGWPYIDTGYFDLVSVPDLKMSQYWSSNFYEVGTTHGGAPSAFGVNHGTGHIKAYPDGSDGQPMARKFVRAVRGDAYCVNDFVDNGDGTVADNTTGLIWLADDSGEGIDWGNALAYAEACTAGGHDDWRLPNVRELQSIVDYSGVYPAIDQTYFNITDIDAYFWTSTSAHFGPDAPEYCYAWYVAFGYAVGPDGTDVHGAGAVRFDTKVEGGPAGQEPERVYNYARCVRDAETDTGIPE